MNSPARKWFGGISATAVATAVVITSLNFIFNMQRDQHELRLDSDAAFGTLAELKQRVDQMTINQKVESRLIGIIESLIGKPQQAQSLKPDWSQMLTEPPPCSPVMMDEPEQTQDSMMQQQQMIPQEKVDDFRRIQRGKYGGSKK